MPILLKNKYIAFSSDPVVEMWVKPLSDFNTKYPGCINCISIYVDPCIFIMKSLIKVPLNLVRYL